MLSAMILRPKPFPQHQSQPSVIDLTAPVAPVPSWLRKAVEGPQGLEDAAIAAGAAIGSLDAVVRRQERWAGVWRQRLALAAAATTARQAGRAEDEAALRDAVCLTRPGDEVGPGGRILLAWRRLALLPAEDLLTEAGLAAALDELGHGRNDEALIDLVEDLRQLSRVETVVPVLTGAFANTERDGCARSLGPWLADAMVAQRLGWPHAVPMLGTLPPTPSGRTRGARLRATKLDVEASTQRVQDLLQVQARAALRAIDLSAELGRRAERLIAVAPKLRAKGADLVIEKLLAEDAVVASDRIAGMSDRGLRRLFDRLVDFGAVRELTGRATFRVYGL